MGLYCEDSEVKLRLRGKIRFTDDEDDDNKFPNTLLTKLVQEAEADVEQDLSPRFEIPFQGTAGEAFSTLPDHTQRFLKTMCELKSVIRVLETDFGSGGASDSDKYTKNVQERYDKMKDKILSKEEKWRQWSFPPLPGLRLAYFNTESDDGFSGMVLTTGEVGSGDFPKKQLNDPSQNFWNGTIDETDY